MYQLQFSITSHRVKHISAPVLIAPSLLRQRILMGKQAPSYVSFIEAHRSEVTDYEIGMTFPRERFGMITAAAT
jgi:hypothetical protein